MNLAVIPQLDRCKGAVSLWQRCVAGASVYSTCAEKFLDTLSEVYAAVLSEGDAESTDAGTVERARATVHVCILLTGSCVVPKSVCVWSSEYWTGGYLDVGPPGTARR